MRGSVFGTELRSMMARSILGSVQLQRENEDDEDEEHGADTEDYRLMKKKRFVATRSRYGKSTTKSDRGDVDNQDMHGEDELDAEYYPQSKHAGGDKFELVLTEDGKLVVRNNQSHNAAAGKAASATAMDADDDDNGSQGDDADKDGSSKMRRLLQAKNQQQQQQQHWREQKKAMKQGQQKKKFNLKDPGSDYRAKNAGGDVWKKGSLQPHAYIPLDPRLLSKKHKSLAVEHFGQVVNNNTAAARKKLKLKGRK
jgi:ribosomal RNA-processing protein 12